MTASELKRRFRASSTRVGELVCISAEHPADGLGVLIQSELDTEEQARTGHRFHCRILSETEALAAIKAIRKALAYSRRLVKRYEADIARAYGGQ